MKWFLESFLHLSQIINKSINQGIFECKLFLEFNLELLSEREDSFGDNMFIIGHQIGHYCLII